MTKEIIILLNIVCLADCSLQTGISWQLINYYKIRKKNMKKRFNSDHSSKVYEHLPQPIIIIQAIV